MGEVLIPRERRPGESRVAATPETVKKLVQAGLLVKVERGSGEPSFIADARYSEAGAHLVSPDGSAFSEADLLLKVSPPSVEEVQRLREGAHLISFFAPHRHPDMVRALVQRKITAWAMEFVPRITRAQRMDALSSQANIAGYKAAVLAASILPKYFPLLMTAAGTVQPAKAVVLGAGVAGLQALATLKRLGAVVEVSDIRPAVKEQVASLGGRFIDLPMGEGGEGAGGYAEELQPQVLQQQQEVLHGHMAAADVIITTALVPGRPAPRLIAARTVAAMRPGSVIVDLAAEQGGNCELTVAGETVVHQGITLVGHTNLPATLPMDASALYARNVFEVAMLLLDDGKLAPNLEDEILHAMVLTHQGQILHPKTAQQHASSSTEASAL